VLDLNCLQGADEKPRLTRTTEVRLS
jgi:hypothetical protein